MKEPPTLFERASCEDEIIDSTGAGVVLAEIDSKGWSGVMAAKEEKVATMKEEIVSKHRKVEEQTNEGPPVWNFVYFRRTLRFFQRNEITTG